MDTTKLLKFSESVAREAGGVLAASAHLRHVNFQDARDVKLRADVESEKLIRSRLQSETSFPIVGEEEGGDSGLLHGEEPYWVVDPLDGTYNYLREMGLCCVSIGLMRGLEPVLGVVYDFNTDELFSADAAAETPGLLINGVPHASKWAESRDLGVLCTGFPAGRDYSSEALSAFIQQVQSFKKIRMLGSSAIAISYVAAGRCDAYFEETVRLWDVAGGLALIRAAGAPYLVRHSTSGLPFAVDVRVGMAVESDAI